jgi:hypothetical protein
MGINVDVPVPDTTVTELHNQIEQAMDRALSNLEERLMCIKSAFGTLDVVENVEFKTKLTERGLYLWFAIHFYENEITR